MATISANALGVYTLEIPQTSPLETITSSDDTISGLGTSGYTDGEIRVALTSTGAWLDVVQYTASPSPAWASYGSITLVSAATSTNLEASNTVNETVASNGDGTSTTYIVGGAMSWSMSVDGLLDLSTAGVGNGTNVMDIARNKYYAIVKFDTGTSVYYAGQALIDSVSLSGGVDDIATYSASFSGYGDLYKS